MKDRVQAAIFGIGAGALIAAMSMTNGPIGTLTAVGFILLILSR